MKAQIFKFGNQTIEFVHKCSFVSMSKWVHFSLFIFYYERIILWFNLLNKYSVQKLCWCSLDLKVDRKVFATELWGFVLVRESSLFTFFVGSLNVLRIQRLVCWSSSGLLGLTTTNLLMDQSWTLKHGKMIWMDLLWAFFVRFWCRSSSKFWSLNLIEL